MYESWQIEGGSVHGDDHVPYLNWNDTNPELNANWNDNANPNYGAASRGSVWQNLD